MQPQAVPATTLALALASLLAACGTGARPPGGLVDASDPGAPDADPGGGDGGVRPVGSSSVYASTAKALFRVDPDTLAITPVGNYGGDFSGDSMTDIAIDAAGTMIGVSFTAVYRVDPSTAVATLLSRGLTGNFNGLSFVPSEAAGMGAGGPDVLVGTRNQDGAVFRIDPATGAATKIGDMGAFSSSGDLVAVEGFGTVLTAEGGANPDVLVRLAAPSFAATAVGGSIGFDQIWGLAYWKNKIFGFTAGGQFVLIDPATGAGTLVSSNGEAWWGAAVTTTAPILQ